jgi:hypothetical protein
MRREKKKTLWWTALVAAIPTNVDVVSPFGETEPLAAIRAAEPTATIVLDAPAGVSLDKVLDLVKATGDQHDVLVGVDDSAESRRLLKQVGFAHVFRLETSERLFASTFVPPTSAISAEPLPTETIRLVKRDATEAEAEERIVYGIVLEPDTTDSQMDVVSAAEIRQAAHEYMESFANIGLQHQVFVNGSVRILETFIAPADFVIADQVVRAGSWVMAMRVIDDDLWKSVKSGGLTGFSIGGAAHRVPLAT